MKRPFAVLGFAYLSALLMASYLTNAANAALAVLLALCSVFVFLFLKFLTGRREIAAAFAAAALAFAVFAGFSLLRYDPAAALDGQTVAISGKIAELPAQSGNSWYYTIQPQKVTMNGKRVQTGPDIRLKLGQRLNAQPFDAVSVKAELYLPPDGSDGGFDSRSYYRSKGIYLFAKPLGTPTVTAAKSRPPYYYAIVLRQYVSGVLNTAVRGQWGSLASGILIGDVSKLPETVKSDFSVTGISHILAVSGTQISLIMEYMLLVLCALRMRKRLAAVFAAAAVLLFMAVTGFSPSVMRAGVMSLVYLGGLLIRREADALNSLGFSALVLCLLNPYAATDVGLLLSLTATLGMVTVSGRCERALAAKAQKLPEMLRHACKAPAGLLCETFGASLLTYPVIMLTFGQISLVTLFSNMLEVPVSLFVTLAAAVIVLLTPLRIFTFLIRPLALLIRFATAFMMGYAHALASVPFASISTAYGFIGIFLVFALLAVLLYFLFRGRGASLKVVAACLSFTLIVGIASYMVAADGVLTITELPVLGGSCTVLVEDGSAIIWDMEGSGADYQAEQYLKSCGIRRIEALILPAYDRKRVDTANSFLSTVPASKIFVPGAYRSDENPYAVCVSQPIVLNWKGMLLTITPSRDQKTLLASLSDGDSVTVLTGGADADLADYALGGQQLAAGLLVFGGNVTKSFATAVSPQIAIGSGSANAAFGGALLKSENCVVHDTDEDGQIIMRTRGDGRFMRASGR